MKDFFAPIYEIFKSLYGSDLADHLYGLDPAGTGDFTARSLYVTVGFLLIFITLFVVLSYYFLLNSPRYNRWYHWMGFMVANFITNLILGFYLPFLDYDTGNMAPSVKEVIDNGHLWGFGLANGLLSILLFLMLSVGVKRFSRNCSTVPF